MTVDDTVEQVIKHLERHPITRHEIELCQKLAAVPEEEFEAYVAVYIASGKAPSASELIRGREVSNG
jgi:hypothetical protein